MLLGQDAIEKLCHLGACREVGRVKVRSVAHDDARFNQTAHRCFCPTGYLIRIGIMFQRLCRFVGSGYYLKRFCAPVLALARSWACRR